MRVVKKDSVCCANRHAPVPLRIPRQPQARCEVQQRRRTNRLTVRVRETGVARKEKPQGSVLVNRTANTLVKSLLREKQSPADGVIHRHERLPSKTRTHGQPARGLPSILHVQADIILAVVVSRRILLLELRHSSQHEIAQPPAGNLGAEVDLARSR